MGPGWGIAARIRRLDVKDTLMNHHCDYTRPGVEPWWNGTPVVVHGQSADVAQEQSAA